MNGNVYSNTKDKLAKQLGNVKNRFSMVFYLTIFIFIVTAATSAVLYLIYFLLIRAGIMVELNLYLMFGVLLITCVVVSTSLVRGFGNRILFGSLKQIISTSKAVAAGDFSKRLEPAREKEIAEICNSFNEMVDRLGRNELLARDFISNVSHQFRNPLASISGYAQLLENGNLSESERNEYISIIRQQSDSLSELVNNILELSKVERGIDNFSKEVFAADELLYKCLLNYDNAMAEKNIELTLNVNHATICGNRDLVSEAWANLIENAIKFSNPGGEINISLYEDEKDTVFVITDNGLGMSEDTCERLFERFYRGAEASHTSGNGLGMPIVKSIVDLHGGDISVSSKPGWGSSFVLRLPKSAE